jgi:hypothetical protein
MKKLQIFLIALVAVSAFGALIASSAFAEEPTSLLALWLANGLEVKATLATDSEGELLLEDNKAPFVGKAAVVCSGLFEGTVSENGEDKATMLFNLGTTQKLIPTNGETGFLIAGNGLLCKAESPVTGCEENEAETEAFPVDLPYNTLLLLITGPPETFRIMYTSAVSGGKVGYELACLIASILTEDECTATEVEGEALNVTGGVEAMGSATPNGTCTQGGAASGVITAIAGNLTLLTNGETLSMSE